MDGPTNGRTGGWTDRLTDRWMDRRTNGRTNGWTVGRTDRQTDSPDARTDGQILTNSKFKAKVMHISIANVFKMTTDITISVKDDVSCGLSINLFGVDLGISRDQLDLWNGVKQIL